MTDHRYVHSLFCDDVRQEDNGKRIYIGVYSAKMLIRAFPATLPSFVIALTIATPASRPITELRVRLLKDDEEFFSATLSPESLEKTAKNARNNYAEDIDERMIQHQAQFRLSPFQLDGPCDIKVRVDTEDGELRGGPLEVAQAPSGEQNS